MQELLDVRTLPVHTHKEVIFGKIRDCVWGRINGFTVKPNLDYPRGGYLVGTGIQEKHFNEKNLGTVRNHINQIFNSIGENHYIGGWRDENVCIVEISKQFDSLDEALKFGRENNQKAIWDVSLQKEIFIPNK